MDAACLVSAVVAVALYANTWGAGFVYDDNRAVVANEDVWSGASLSGLWTHDFWGTPLRHSGSHGSYRPLTVLSFRLDALLWGRSGAGGFHVTNSVLHGAATAATVRWARCLTRDSGARVASATAWAAGLLFATHPAHTEAVAGVVGRADVGAALCMLLALLAHDAHARLRERLLLATAGVGALAWGRCHTLLALAVLLGVCATLTKEHGVATLAICIVVELLYWLRPTAHVAHKRAALRSAASLTASLALLVATRTLLVGGRLLPDFATADNPASRHASPVTRTLTFLFLPVFNLWLLLCPSTLSFDWSMDAVPLVHSWSDARNLATLFLYSSIACVAVLSYKRCVATPTDVSEATDVNANHKVVPWRIGAKRSVPGSPQLVPLCVSAMVLAFLPSSNLVAYVGFVVAERVLYLPSVAYCVLVAYGAAHLFCALRNRRRRRVVVAIGVAYLLVLGARTVTRNYDWHDEESLYRSGIAVNPPKAYGNLGSILSSKGDLKQAEYCYLKALSYRPNMADVHYNLGILYQTQQRLPEAINSYQMAINYRPRLALAHLNLGVALWRQGLVSSAASVLRRGAALDGSGLKDPRSHEHAVASCRLQLGRLQLETGSVSQALDTLQGAVDSLPAWYQPQGLFNLLGEAHARLGHDADAERWFQASLRAKPDHVPAHLTYGRLLAKNESRVREAEWWFRKARKLAPGDASVLRHYGQFLLHQRRDVEAARLLVEAASLDAEGTLYEDAMNTAASLRRSGDLEGALTFYKMAVNMRPTEAAGVGNLGALYHLMSRYEEAEKFYKEALRLQPDDPVTLGNLRRLRRAVT